DRRCRRLARPTAQPLDLLLGVANVALDLALRLLAELLQIDTPGLFQLALNFLFKRSRSRANTIGDRPFALLAGRKPGNESEGQDHERDSHHRLDDPPNRLLVPFDVEAITEGNKHQVGDAGDDPADIQKYDKRRAKDGNRISLHRNPEQKDDDERDGSQ